MRSNELTDDREPWALQVSLLSSFQSANFVSQKRFLTLFLFSRLHKRVQNWKKVKEEKVYEQKQQNFRNYAYTGMTNSSRGGFVDRGECNKLPVMQTVRQNKSEGMVGTKELRENWTILALKSTELASG